MEAVDEANPPHKSPRFGAARTHREIAAVMTARGYPMTRQNVYETELRALRKLRRALAELEPVT